MKYRNTSVLLVLLSLSFDSAADEEVVVTGHRTPVDIDTVGSTFSIIDREYIERRNPIAVSDLLRDVPGLSINRSGPLGTQTVVRMRGGEGNHVLVLIDGIEMNDRSQDDTLNFADLMTEDIERLEVVRGPQSALWGSDALSGVINIVTQTGRGAPRVSGSLEGGSFGTFRASGAFSGASERYDYRLAAAHLTTDGTDIRAGLPSDVGDDDGYDNTRLSFRGGMHPSENLSVQTSILHTDSTNQFDGGGVDTDINESDNRYTYAMLQAKLDTHNDRWQNLLRAATTRTDHDTTTGGEFNASQEADNYKFIYQSSVFFDTPSISASHAATVAYEYEKTEYDAATASPFALTPTVSASNRIDSVVGEYRLSLRERLFLSGSARHDDNTDFDDSTTYRITAAARFPDTATRWHASYGTGVKNPLFVELNSAFGRFVGNPNLKPESSKAWDIGIDQTLWDGRFEFGVTYFRERLEDEIVNDFSNFPFFTAVNLTGESKRKGVEVTAALRLTADTDVSATYTYLDATQPDPVSGQQTREIRRPRHIASVNLNHRFLAQRGNLNVGVNYNGEMEDTDFTQFPSQNVTLDSYTLINVAASFAVNDRLTVFGRIENLLDDEYQEPLGFFASGIGLFAGIRFDLEPW